ncbi:MAG: thiamine pyrophosphate-dependent dehydrogenase E1 component subunit alpha [Spirochaetia bacterium]|nr:thiamine pyrophosphate-dependent dehydrogenase E1 component subunit alpha [Spirochaetia bacterium]
MDKQTILQVYETMLTIRKFEEKALHLFEENKLRGSVHLSIGQEAVAAVVGAYLRDKDYITSTHRGHGHAIAKGARPDKAMAELMGRETGYCGGRGGSMHIADVEKGNLGANAIVGGGIPHANGAALSAQLRGTDQVAVSFFGDGAANEGIFHETLNIASIWKLPVIFICENNQYGMTTAVDSVTSVKDIAVRAAGYDMPGEVVDGNDVFAMEKAVKKAIKRAQDGEGPTLIEAKTYRWKGHWTGDPEVYRTRDEVEEWKTKCPIKRLEKHMQDKKILSLEQIEATHTKIDKLIDEAEEFALSSPDPDPATVLDNVYYEGDK